MDNDYLKLEELLDDLYDLINESKSGGLFGGGKPIDKEEAFDIIQSIRLNIPLEIKKAQKVNENRERYEEEARNSAKNIIREAEAEAERLISNHEITKRAREASAEMEEDAKRYVREMKTSVIAYAEKCLAKTQAAMQESIDLFTEQSRVTEEILNKEVGIVYGHIQELRDNE